MSGKRISCAEFRRLWLDRAITIDAIAEMLGVTRQAVCSRAKARGLPGRGANQEHNRAIPPERDAEFRKMWAARASVQEICAAFGCKPHNVRDHARRLGFKMRVKGWRPYPADPALVRQLFDAGLSWGEISKATGASKPTLRAFCYQRGMKRTSSWRPSMTLAEWREQQAAAAMAAMAERERSEAAKIAKREAAWLRRAA